ncbi:MAG: cation:proton antiporter, partial [Gemmatimonadales bacterium]
IMEDLVAILLLATLPAIASGSQVSPEDLAGMLGRLGLFMALVVVVGLLVVPRVFRAIVRLRRPETTLVASVGFCFAVAQLAFSVGYSVALGAFLAGSLIAESGAARQISALVRPLRDMFAAIFFVAVGMLIDPLVIAAHWGAVLVLVAVVLLGKVVGVSIGAFLSGAGTRTAVRSGMSMAQIGEFSFIIAGAGLAVSPSGNFLYPLAVAVSVITAFTTPWMVRWSEPAALMVDRRLPHALQTFATLYGSWVETLRSKPRTVTPGARARRYVRLLLGESVVLAAIIVGTSLLIPYLLPKLEPLGIDARLGRWALAALGATVAFPFCYGMVRAARRLALAMAAQAFPVVKAGAVDLGNAPRRALVITLEIAIILVVGIPLVAVTLPFVPNYSGPVFLIVILALVGIAFWRSATDLQGHVRATSDLVVEALARQGSGPDGNLLERVQEMLPGIGTLFPVALTLESPAVASSLAELNLRGRTGATVVALCRGDQRIVFPEAPTRLQAGDLLALTGSHDAIATARAILLEENPVVPPHGGTGRSTPTPPSRPLD